MKTRFHALLLTLLACLLPFGLNAATPEDAREVNPVEVDGETYKELEDYGIDLEDASGRDHHLLPVPAVFLTDGDGRITYRYFNADYKKRLSAKALLKAAK